MYLTPNVALLYFLALVKAKHGGATAQDLEKWLQELLELICNPRQGGEHWGEYETKLLDHFMMMMLEGNSELKLPKPYNKNLAGNHDVAFNKIDKLELPEQAKAVIHGLVFDHQNEQFLWCDNQCNKGETQPSHECRVICG